MVGNNTPSTESEYLREDMIAGKHFRHSITSNTTTTTTTIPPPPPPPPPPTTTTITTTTDWLTDCSCLLCFRWSDFLQFEQVCLCFRSSRTETRVVQFVCWCGERVCRQWGRQGKAGKASRQGGRQARQARQAGRQGGRQAWWRPWWS